MTPIWTIVRLRSPQTLVFRAPEIAPRPARSDLSHVNAATIGRKDVQTFSLQPGKLASQTNKGLQAICSEILGLDLGTPSKEVDWKSVASQLAGKLVDQQRGATIKSLSDGFTAAGSQLETMGDFNVATRVVNGTLELRARPLDKANRDGCTVTISRRDDDTWSVCMMRAQTDDGGSATYDDRAWTLPANADSELITSVFNAGFGMVDLSQIS